MALTEALPTPAKPRVGRTADPCVMVIFGVTGDLTRRKLLPALYNLASQGLLSREFAVQVVEEFRRFAQFVDAAPGSLIVQLAHR